MSNKLSVAILAALMTGAAMASTAAYAQTKPIQSPPPREMDPAKRVPPPAEPAQEAAMPESAAPVVQQAPQPSQFAGSQQHYSQRAASWEEGRGGAFLSVQGGRGEVYDGVNQDALAISTGYRWQAGPIWLVGLEVAAGRLDSTTEGRWAYSKVEYASVGANARFNFGQGAPVYGLLRGGYFSADEKGTGSADGGYFGVGLGMDLGRRFNMSVIYTNYVYFNDLYWSDGDLYYDASRADTLMLGAEVRF